MTRFEVLVGSVCLAAITCSVSGAQPVRGEPAPTIALKDLLGMPFDSETQRGQTLVITFGELYHDRTLEACGIIRELLENPKLEGQEVRSVLVVAQNVERRALLAQARGNERLPKTVLHDTERDAFGTYRVTVMPSTVVVDRDGRVVYELAGLTNRYGDVLGDALLLATGNLSPEDFEQTLAAREKQVASEEFVRAERLSNLARQLMRRGMLDLAAEEYAKALEIAPDHVPARVGAGAIMLRKGRMAEAETHFRVVLEAQPHSVEAALGLAQVQVLRGGSEILAAENLLRAVTTRNPDEARAHYLLGTIHAMRDEHEQAAASFRTVAELLMRSRESWDVVPGENGDE